MFEKGYECIGIRNKNLLWKRIIVVDISFIKWFFIIIFINICKVIIIVYISFFIVIGGGIVGFY